MKIVRNILAMSAMATALGACGNKLTFEEAVTKSDAMLNDIIAAGPTTPSTLPTSGSASYTGYMFATTGSSVGLAGEANMNANFSAGSVTGKITNIVDHGDYGYDGSLAITGGTIDRTADPLIGEPTFVANVGGTISDDSFAYSINATMEGEFAGTNHDYILGVFNGTISGSFATDSIVGGVVAEK